MSIISRLRDLWSDARSGSASPPIACEDAVRRVHEFLDGELEDVVASEVQAHFDTCQRCYPRLRFERSFRDAVRRAAGRDSASEELRERLLRLISETRIQA